MANFPSINFRSSCSLPKLILSSLNLVLIIISLASFAPLLLLRTPPSPFGWALFAVSSITFLSSLLGSYYLFTTYHCRSLFITQVSLLVVSSIGQALAFFSFLLQPDASLSLLQSVRRNLRVLMRMEEFAMLAMFVLGSIVLVLECMFHDLWVSEYEDVEAKAEAVKKGKRMNRRMARVRVESVVENSGEMDDRLKSKCVMNEEEAKAKFYYDVIENLNF